MSPGHDGGAAAIAAYCPKGCPEAAAAFARAVVSRAGPATAARARDLLWACSHLARFGVEMGLEPTPEVLLHPGVIERFVVVGLAGAPVPRRRTVRTNLRHVARRVGVLAAPHPVALPRSRAKAPYSRAEIDALLALARAQPTLARHMRLQALVCLGAGGGLGAADLRHVRGSHVVARSGGLVVVIEGGRAPRVVPVLARYHAPLRASAAFAADGYLLGGVSPHRHNVTNRLVASVDGGRDLPRLALPRLRATWAATCAGALGLPALLAAAGVSHSQWLADVAATLPTLTEAECVRLLGGGD